MGLIIFGLYSKVSAALFFEVENQNVEIIDSYTRDELGRLIPFQTEAKFGQYSWGQSGSYLICIESSDIRGSSFDSGTVAVKLDRTIPSGIYDIWYRITVGGRDFAPESKWYGWIEWPSGRTNKRDLGPYLRENPRRTFAGWVKVAEKVQLSDLNSKELICYGEDADNTNRYVYTIWDAICLSNDPDFIPPQVVPVGGWEGVSTLLPSETIPLDQKKIITLGGGGGPTPNFTTLKIDIMEKTLPVDGIIMSCDFEGYPHYKEFFTLKRIQWDVVDEWSKYLKETAFKRFTDNFLRMNVVPGLAEEVDWFNDKAWDIIIDKWRLIATVAKKGGIKGIFIDTEQYSGDHNGTPFMYPNQLHKNEKSFVDYSDQVRRRGRELMESIEDIYPDITIIFTFSTSIVGVRQMPDPDLSSDSYGLLPAFIDGMLEGGPKATFVDGWEGSYLYKRYQQFVDAYEFIKDQGANLSQVPKLYKEKMKVGFGLWPEQFTKEELKYALHYALRVSDGYVWFLMSGLKAWKPTPQIEAACIDISWTIEESRKEQPLDEN